MEKLTGVKLLNTGVYKMADLVDDDLVDYSEDEEFNEDKLNDEDYDSLYDALPKLKGKVAQYNDQIGELDLKEALYYNYFNIDDAFNELKERYPKKKQTGKYICFMRMPLVSCLF